MATAAIFSEWLQRLSVSIQRVGLLTLVTLLMTNGKDPGQKPYRFLKAIRKSNFMSVSPPHSACLPAKVA